MNKILGLALGASNIYKGFIVQKSSHCILYMTILVTDGFSTQCTVFFGIFSTFTYTHIKHLANKNAEFF